MQASHRSIHSPGDGSRGLAPEDVCFRPPEKMSPATSSSIRFLVSLSHPSLVFSLNRTVMDARHRGPLLRPMPPAALRCRRLGATSTRTDPRRLSPSSSLFLLPLAQLSVPLVTSRSSTTPPWIGSSHLVHRSSPPPDRAPVAGNGLPKPGSALPRLSPPPRVTFEQENASASSARFAMDRRTSPARLDIACCIGGVSRSVGNMRYKPSKFRKRSECEDSFDYVGLSFSWIRSSFKRDLSCRYR